MKFGCSIGIFLNSANLICRSTDISKSFRGSLRLRENESRLYIQIRNAVVVVGENYASIVGCFFEVSMILSFSYINLNLGILKKILSFT